MDAIQDTLPFLFPGYLLRIGSFMAPAATGPRGPIGQNLAKDLSNGSAYTAALDFVLMLRLPVGKSDNRPVADLLADGKWMGGTWWLGIFSCHRFTPFRNFC